MGAAGLVGQSKKREDAQLLEGVLVAFGDQLAIQRVSHYFWINVIEVDICARLMELSFVSVRF